MIVNFYSNEKTSISQACIEGFKKYDKVQIISDKDGYSNCDIVVTWGIVHRDSQQKGTRLRNIINYHKENNGIHVIIEQGYTDRNKFYSLGLNGLNGYAQFFNQNSPPDRARKQKLALGRWEKRKNNKVLVCGQVPWDAAVQHICYNSWLKKTIKYLINTEKKIIFRYHPKLIPKNKMYNRESRRYKQIIHQQKIINELDIEVSKEKNIWKSFSEVESVVCFNSNVGVLATMYGLPNLSFDQGSMVYNITGHDLEQINNPYIPSPAERIQWLWDLSYTQWTEWEMKKGFPWKRLRPHVKRMLGKNRNENTLFPMSRTTKRR